MNLQEVETYKFYIQEARNYCPKLMEFCIRVWKRDCKYSTMQGIFIDELIRRKYEVKKIRTATHDRNRSGSDKSEYHP